MNGPFAHDVWWRWGPVAVTGALVDAWIVMAVLVLLALAVRRSLAHRGLLGEMAIAVYRLVEREFAEVLHGDAWPALPLLATLFLDILLLNLSDLIPGLPAATARPETTAALALVVVTAAQAGAIARHGWWGSLRRFAQPNLLFLPLHLLEEATRTLSLTVRLCGNVLSHGLLLAILLLLAGWIVPVPFMALGLLSGIVQAYIFTILAAVYLGEAWGEATPRAEARTATAHPA